MEPIYMKKMININQRKRTFRNRKILVEKAV